MAKKELIDIIKDFNKNSKEESSLEETNFLYNAKEQFNNYLKWAEECKDLKGSECLMLKPNASTFVIYTEFGPITRTMEMVNTHLVRQSFRGFVDNYDKGYTQKIFVNINGSRLKTSDNATKISYSGYVMEPNGKFVAVETDGENKDKKYPNLLSDCNNQFDNLLDKYSNLENEI